MRSVQELSDFTFPKAVAEIVDNSSLVFNSEAAKLAHACDVAHHFYQAFGLELDKQLAIEAGKQKAWEVTNQDFQGAHFNTV